MKRRSFLRSMLALGVAPAAISSGVLMRVKPIVLPTEEEVVEYGLGEFREYILDKYTD